MRSPRYSAVLSAFALTTITVSFRALPTVEASTANPLASVPSRYFRLLGEPASRIVPLQAAAKDDKPTAAQAEVKLPDGKGKDVTQRVCSSCHGVNLFAAQRHTSEKMELDHRQHGLQRTGSLGRRPRHNQRLSCDQSRTQEGCTSYSTRFLHQPLSSCNRSINIAFTESTGPYFNHRRVNA